MNTDKKVVTLWYEAFNKKDPALLDRILGETWSTFRQLPVNRRDLRV